MNPIIRTAFLSRRFGETDAIRNLDLAIPQGSIFALLGANGAGKTTLIKLLMNIISPTGGGAEIFGVSSARLGPAQFQQIGYVSENQELPEWMTVRQYLDYCRPFYPTWDTGFCTRMVGQFQLPLHRKLKHLSRGMKMKAALLSSLAYRPKLLVLDEPFSGLDPLARDEFISGMLALVDESSWTILISSHDVEEVERLVDWVGFLENGSMRVCEPVSRLAERFRTIEAALAGPAEPPASALPLTWMNVETSAHSLRFVESDFHAHTTAADVQSFFPHAGDIQASAMSLREIFVALARNPRARMLAPF